MFPPICCTLAPSSPLPAGERLPRWPPSPAAAPAADPPAADAPLVRGSIVFCFVLCVCAFVFVSARGLCVRMWMTCISGHSGGVPAWCKLRLCLCLCACMCLCARVRASVYVCVCAIVCTQVWVGAHAHAPFCDYKVHAQGCGQWPFWLTFLCVCSVLARVRSVLACVRVHRGSACAWVCECVSVPPCMCVCLCV
jgi:hypothetical protein